MGNLRTHRSLPLISSKKEERSQFSPRPFAPQAQASSKIVQRMPWHDCLSSCLPWFRRRSADTRPLLDEDDRNQDIGRDESQIKPPVKSEAEFSNFSMNEQDGEEMKKICGNGVCTAMTVDWFQDILSGSHGMNKNPAKDPGNLRRLVSEQEEYRKLAGQHAGAVEYYMSSKDMKRQELTSGKIGEITDLSEILDKEDPGQMFQIAFTGAEDHTIGLYKGNNYIAVRDQNLGQKVYRKSLEFFTDYEKVATQQGYTRWRIYAVSRTTATDKR